MRSTFQALALEITQDGKVDASEANILRAHIFADGEVSREEAELLISINNTVSGNENSPRFDALFVEGVTASVLEDSTSPGTVDEEEASWLVSQFSSDGKIDTNERAALANIKQRARGTLPASLTNLMATHSI